MNSRVLYIGNQRVDLPDSVSFNLVWQCAEPGELKIYGSGSSTIKLPFTPTNDAVFRYSKFLTVVGGREFETFDKCRYYERGVLMIDNGTAFLVSVSDGYEICLTWGNGDYIQKLKDTSVANLGGDTFAWNDTVRYPYVETSQQPDDYATFYRQGAEARFRHALTRPIYNYRNILSAVGINSANCPTNVWKAAYSLWLQANSLQAKGRLVISLRVDHFESYDWERILCAPNLIQTIEIDTAGKYTLSIPDRWQPYTQYYKWMDGYYDNKLFPYSGNTSICFYLTNENPYNKYSSLYAVGRNGGWKKAFVQDRTQDTYAPMYKATTGGEGSLGSVSSVPFQKPAMVGYSQDIDGDIICHAPGNPEETEVSLAKGTYYLMAVMASSVSTDPDDFPDTMTDFERSKLVVDVQGGGVSFLVNNDSSTDTKIETPGAEILQTRPPKVVQMLGYSTAYDIVSDFMRLFPLMLIMRGDTPQYFDFTTVLANKPVAYDFSSYFVSLDKIEFGNTKVGLRNEVKMAEYEDFTGKRANGSFTTLDGKGTGGDYTQLSRITSYDTMMAFNGVELPYFPSAEISYDDKTASYTAKLQERPNLLMYTGALMSMSGDDNKTYSVQKTNSQRDTLQYIIDTYWQDFISIVGTQKTVTVTLNINPGELQDFDFRRPVYIKQLSVYLFAQKITYKGDGAAELQGIVLPSTATGTPFPVDADGVLVDAADNYVVDSADNYVVEQ